MHLNSKNGFVRHTEDRVRPLEVLTSKRLVDGSVSPRQNTEIAQWKLSFWARGRVESGEGQQTDIWCNSEGEARQRFGEYRRILESHTLIISRVELLAPSGESVSGIVICQQLMLFGSPGIASDLKRCVYPV